MDFVFNNVILKDKSILDIGGGKGLFSFYCACMGAKYVKCLEPESSGSTKNVSKNFNLLKEQLGIDNIEISSVAFQALKPTLKYNVILLHNSINHLNEVACTLIKSEKWAEDEYRKIFNKLKSITSAGAQLIICDCSSENFFPSMGIKNPFAKSIEWHKHQTPKIWANLLTQCGFSLQGIRWSSPNSLGKLGNVLLGNKWASFFLTSHFCM